MSDDPISTIIIAGAAAGAGKLVEKAWESAEKWLATFFKDHHPRAKVKAIDNSSKWTEQLSIVLWRSPVLGRILFVLKLVCCGLRGSSNSL